MSFLTTPLVVVALMGCALVGGIFLAFSSFIMKSLARLPSSEGIAAMQSINVVVLNRLFLGLFMGTAAISLLIIVLSTLQWGTAASLFFVTGGALYFVGTFLVTVIGNVPLNNRLAAVSAPDAGAVSFWEHYLERWTLFNTVRTVAAVAAASFFIVGLLGSSNV